MTEPAATLAPEPLRRIEPNTIRARHRDLGVELAPAGGPDDELRIGVPGAKARVLLERLANEEETAARRLVDLTVIDRGPASAPELRFEVVYRLYSASRAAALRVHARVDGRDPTIESVTGIWPAADWLEREAFDLFGLHFKGHPDLRRLFLDPSFEGAPLRKDAPSGAGGESA